MYTVEQFDDVQKERERRNNIEFDEESIEDLYFLYDVQSRPAFVEREGACIDNPQPSRRYCSMGAVSFFEAIDNCISSEYNVRYTSSDIYQMMYF